MVHKVIVSVSYGDDSQPRYEKTTHMMTFSDIEFDAEKAKTLADGLVEFVTGVVDKDSGNTVLGVYSIEEPNKQPVQ